MSNQISKNQLWSERIPYLKFMKDFYSKIDYNGINLWPVMAGEVYTDYYFSHIDQHEEPSFKKKLLFFIKNLFFEEKFKVKGEGRILVSFFMDREDHHDFFKKAFSAFPKKDLSEIDAFEYKQKKHFKRGKTVFPNLFLLFRIWNSFRKAKVKRVLKNYYWLHMSKVYFRIGQIRDFKDIIQEVKPKGYIAFCSSAFPEESILTLLSKKQKIPTFTLQHGFYSPSKEKFISTCVQNENVISDYHLLWGNTSKSNMEEWLKGKSKSLVVGNPKYSLQTRDKSGLENITVFLSVPAKQESNKKIVKILNDFAKKHSKSKIYFKVHPFDDKNNYSTLLTERNVSFLETKSSIPEVLKNSDLVITHYTTIEIEALLYRIPVLRFRDKESLPFWKFDDQFENLEEFERQFLKLKNSKERKRRLKFYEKESKKNFYFEKGKSVPRVYYEKIMEKIKV